MRILSLLLLFCISCHAQLASNTVRRPIYTDTQNIVIVGTVVWTNQADMRVEATSSNHLVRYSQFTNASATNITSGILPIARGGTGTNSTFLIGTWTNSINFKTLGTNDANAFAINGAVGKTASVSNLSAVPGVTNVTVWTNGVFANSFTIP